MTIDEAYQKATDAGYSGRLYAPVARVEFLDPLFWQCLGKVEGWEEEVLYSTGVWERHYDPDPAAVDELKDFIEKTIPEWLYHWHRFIDHLAEGKDPESFFTSL